MNKRNTTQTDAPASDQPSPNTTEIKVLPGPSSKSLAHPDVLFPPIADEDLRDGRTREGKAQRKYLNRREAYIKAWEMAGGFELAAAQATRERLREYRNGEQLQARVDRLIEQVNLIGRLMTLAFQLGLIVRQRPEAVTVSVEESDCVVVNFTLAGMQFSVWPNSQSVILTPRGREPRAIYFDSKGNITGHAVDTLLGIFMMAGITVNPEDVRAALSAEVSRQMFKPKYPKTSHPEDLTALRHTRVAAALGSTALTNVTDSASELSRYGSAAQDALAALAASGPIGGEYFIDPYSRESRMH